MDPDVADCVEGDEIILTVDVPDDILERAAGSAEGRAITWIYCTPGLVQLRLAAVISRISIAAITNEEVVPGSRPLLLQSRSAVTLA